MVVLYHIPINMILFVCTTEDELKLLSAIFDNSKVFPLLPMTSDVGDTQLKSNINMVYDN